MRRPARVVISPSTNVLHGRRALNEIGAYVLTESAFRKEPILTQFAFERLLQWLDDGVDSRGERYLEIRNRLVSYFERRGRPDPDALADETLNRVARTLEQEGTIQTKPPAKYCYVVARFVLLEDFRRKDRHVHLRDSGAMKAVAAGTIRTEPDDEQVMFERRLARLERCLAELRGDHRELVVDYYRDERREKIHRRRRIAARLGISMNALGIRVCRIRDKLMACMERRTTIRRGDGFVQRLSYTQGDRSGPRPVFLIRK